MTCKNVTTNLFLRMSLRQLSLLTINNACTHALTNVYHACMQWLAWHSLDSGLMEITSSLKFATYTMQSGKLRNLYDLYRFLASEDAENYIHSGINPIWKQYRLYYTSTSLYIQGHTLKVSAVYSEYNYTYCRAACTVDQWDSHASI